jgi:hypothetical protein
MPRARDVEQKDRPIHTLPAAWGREYGANNSGRSGKMPAHELEARGPIRPDDRGPAGIPPQDSCHQSRSSCLESRYEAVREASKRMVEGPAKDVSGKDPNRGTLETPGPWRTEFRNDGVSVHCRAVKSFPYFSVILAFNCPELRPGSSRLALVCIAGQCALSSGQVDEYHGRVHSAITLGGMESTGGMGRWRAACPVESSGPIRSARRPPG